VATWDRAASGTATSPRCTEVCLEHQDHG
jgi:hypothetical protein